MAKKEVRHKTNFEAVLDIKNTLPISTIVLLLTSRVDNFSKA